MNPYYEDEAVKIFHGDCLAVLRTMPANSIDSIVTDPPYGLSFMGKKWDYDVPSAEIWAECLRVLKPGGHLLAFAGTRTQHRMAVRIEDAGFEIRDMIAWVYGSGFPKSLDVSKAIDEKAGAKREVVGERRQRANSTSSLVPMNASAGAVELITAPATEAAKKWEGWGTALKPAIETVTVAIKPLQDETERNIIVSSLLKLETQLCLLSSNAKPVGSDSVSSLNEFAAACAIAQWNVEQITNTRAALCARMGTSRLESALISSLSIVSSWRSTLDASLQHGNTFTTGTESSMTTDWKTLRFCLSQIMPESIILASSLPGGFDANAHPAALYFSASLSSLQNILTLSALAPAISRDLDASRDVDERVRFDPVIMARKPLGRYEWTCVPPGAEGCAHHSSTALSVAVCVKCGAVLKFFPSTVAENVLTHGTGGINVDGCRVPIDPEADASQLRTMTRGKRTEDLNGQKWGMSKTGEDAPQVVKTAGRWPANLIHDGSEEVTGLFPHTKSGSGEIQKGGDKINPGGWIEKGRTAKTWVGDEGSAARFFYCAKSSKADRNAGLDDFETVSNTEMVGRDADSAGINNPRAGAGRTSGAKNPHPTVKPTELMRYLCRLVTPPGGVVLDPFMGSGSTGRAAILERFGFVGIEREEQYLHVAQARILSARKEINAARNTDLQATMDL